MSLTKSAATIAAEVAAYEAQHGPIAPDTDAILPTSEAFLEMAAQHASTKVQRLAASANAALQKVREAIWEWDRDALARAETERKRADALREVMAAEKALRDARERARSVGASTRGKQAASGRRAVSEDALASRRAGVIRSGHQRGLHARKPNPNCPACTEGAGGGA